MVTHLQRGNTTIPGTDPLLHCPTLPSGIWPIFTIQLPTMENATVPQRPGPIQLQQAPDSYHGF